MGRYRPSRIVLLLVLLLATALLPWWILLPMGALVALRYSLYLELLIIGWVFDVWFGVPQVSVLNAHLGLVTAIGLIIVAEVLARLIGLRRT